VPASRLRWPSRRPPRSRGARRGPAAGAAVDAATGVLECRDEFTGRELAAVLGNGPVRAGRMLSLGVDLAVSLPGTRAAFAGGIIGRDKAEIIAAATGL